MSLEFSPGRRPPGPDCIDRHVYGQDSTLYSYILKEHIVAEDQYPPEACTPYKHSTAQIDGLRINSPGITGTGNIDITGTIKSSVQVTADDITLTTRKPFDILHPTKEGYRLRHVCLEGPESGVYFRGRLTDSNNIQLPEYWEGLVDAETITVSLTQIGSSQDLIVDSVQGCSQIKIRSGNLSKIDCYYLVHAERKDGEKLIVEYKGTSINDYPGDNAIYSINK